MLGQHAFKCILLLRIREEHLKVREMKKL